MCKFNSKFCDLGHLLSHQLTKKEIKKLSLMSPNLVCRDKLRFEGKASYHMLVSHKQLLASTSLQAMFATVIWWDFCKNFFKKGSDYF